MAEKGGAGKVLSVQDWEQIMQDFRTSTDLQNKWFKIWSGLSILDLALHTVTKKEFAIKGQLLVFIEENSDALLGSEVDAGMGIILESLRGVLQSSIDGVIVVNSLKENMMVMATTVAIVADVLHSAMERLETLVELFLALINRPNQPLDRQIRALACDCLRELEMTYPCLLYGCVGPLHFLCVNERTHAGQSYILLLTTILENLSCQMYTLRSRSNNYLPILQTTVPLIPFNVPAFLVSSDPGREIQSIPARELTPGNLKEFRKLVAFLWEHPQLLTTVGMLEFVSSLIRIYKALDLSGSLLKHHFSSLLHSYSAISFHIVLLIYTHFRESFDGDEGAILRRLLSLSREITQSLPFRLLGVQWLLGIDALYSQQSQLSIFAPHASLLYPLVFDPLSLKAAKLGALAHCAVTFDKQSNLSKGNYNLNGDKSFSSKLLNEGLVSVSSYSWLPPWSTETQLAFHIFHRFLTVGITHSGQVADLSNFSDSPLFQSIQGIFVEMATRMRKLVPSLLALLDRLMDNADHRLLAEKLLQTFNEELLPKLQANRQLPSYFPLLERIAENNDISPCALIEKLTVYIRQRVDQTRAEAEWTIWALSSQVLGICRTVLLHHQSSRCFHSLAQLLGFICRFFPDIEIRDTARLYLRLLISVPGSRLRYILKYSDARVDEAQVTQVSRVSSLLRSPSPPSYQSQKQTLLVAAYINLTRNTSLLVRHSWSLVLYEAFQSSSGTPNESSSSLPKVKEKTHGISKEGIKSEDASLFNGGENFSASVSPNSALRVMDARASEVILILRRHFAQIPDYVNGPGLKIMVPCTLRFNGDLRQRALEVLESDESPSSSAFSNIPDSWPAIYAVVITFSTTGFYGPIPKVRVPLLLSERPLKNWQWSMESHAADREKTDSLELDCKHKEKYHPEDSIGSSGTLSKEVGKDRKLIPSDGPCEDEEAFCELVVIELEPKQPVPTLVDASVVFSDKEGYGIQGRIDSIPVGIEDLFVKPPLPPDLSPDCESDYLLKLYNALWEACSGPGGLGTETFSLKGGWDGVSVVGSESVKLLEAQVDTVVEAVLQYLARFIVAVNGDPLVAITKDGGILEDAMWQEEGGSSPLRSDVDSSELRSVVPQSLNSELGLQIDLRDRSDSRFSQLEGTKNRLGSFLVLIFLPPRYHLLLKMEVADWSTLVRIRTDHWPCLAHVDEFLESLIADG